MAMRLRWQKGNAGVSGWLFLRSAQGVQLHSRADSPVSSKVSGPLLDRVNIHVEVPAVPYRELVAHDSGEASRVIRDRVVAARSKQTRRFAKRGIYANARMSPKDIKRYCSLDPEGTRLLETAINKLGLSARAYTRILKVSRTIADLESAEAIRSAHISEAIQYRSLDRTPF
jgi:magnesium chelatase family protein